jgi:DNA-binding CsgD family transcriptional regulator
MTNYPLIFDNQATSLTYANIVRHLPYWIAIKNHKSIYVAANERLADLAGFSSPKLMIGLQDKDLNCEASKLHDTFVAQDKEAISKGKVINLDISKYSDGKLHVFFTIKTQIVDGNNNLFVLCTMTELPILTITKLMTKISQKTILEGKNISASYCIQHTNFIHDKINNAILSKRLSEVLFLLLHGKSIKTIGFELQISPKTAEEHINKLKFLFGCNTKSQLIEKAIELGYASIFPLSLLV